MISGTVTPFREAIVRLEVLSASGQAVDLEPVNRELRAVSALSPLPIVTIEI